MRSVQFVCEIHTCAGTGFYPEGRYRSDRSQQRSSEKTCNVCIPLLN